MKPTPTRIQPIFSPRLWGARSLAPLFPEKTNLPEPLGEAWLTGNGCKIATGPYEGNSLGEAWQQMPREWRGENLLHTAEFPLLVKFIFPTEKLSIQVHPDDAYASVHEKSNGGRGKTEMWYAVNAEPGATLLAGLKPGVTKQKFKEAVESHGNLEDFLQSHEVHTGDTFFIPAGTPHTIGPGMTICEVQQYSDLTYRIYDYDRTDAQGRKRDLHIEKSLEVMKFNQSQEIKTTPIAMPAAGFQNTLQAACPYFATEIWTIEKNLQSPSHLTHFDLLVVLNGAGTITSEGFRSPYHPGECWLIPAALGAFEFNPQQKTTVLRTYVPQLLTLRKFLYHAGCSEDQVARVAFD